MTRVLGCIEFGEPHVLRVYGREPPSVGPGELLVRVAHSCVNPADVMFRRGAYRERLLHISPPWVPGMDLAGVIESVGADYAGPLRPGSGVMAALSPLRPSGGAYAEATAVPIQQLAEVPAGWSIAEAATLPTNGLTALLTLDTLALEPGQSVAVTGGPGAVGTMCIQLAVARGLHVVSDAAPGDQGYLRALGAEVIPERGAEFAHAVRMHHPTGVDAVIDSALIGKAMLNAIADGGQFAVLRGSARGPEPLSLTRAIRVRNIMVPDYVGRDDKFLELKNLAEQGVVTARVADVLPIDQGAQAHVRLESGGVRGRLVLAF